MMTEAPPADAPAEAPAEATPATPAAPGRFAHFDRTAAAPAPVLGWYDPSIAAYADLPEEADRLPLDDEAWAARMQRRWAVQDGLLVPWPEPPAPPARWTVPKALALERIGGADLRRLRAALKMGAADDTLSDAALLLRDRWDAAQEVASDDAEVRGLLAGLGLDPDAILARP